MMFSPLQIGRLRIDPPLFLAPMAGYSDTAFRCAVRAQGGLGLAFTEMINPRSLLGGGGRKRDALLARHAGDTPLGWQIYGSDARWLADAAQYLCQYHQAEWIDINMGCPQRKIAGRGDGAALLREPDLACSLAAAVVEAVPVPVTVKIRIGWDSRQRVAPALAAGLADAGVAAITVHGRTAVQKYTGQADWSAIEDVVTAAGTTPVIGNGDVTTPGHVHRLINTTGCAGVMIGRAALRNPWIFSQTVANPTPNGATGVVPRPKRLRFLLDHLDQTARLYGDDMAAKLFRKWIPLHAGALGIVKPVMVRLLQMTETAALRLALQEAAADGRAVNA